VRPLECRFGRRGQESVVQALESTEDSGLFTAVHRDSLRLLPCMDDWEHQDYAWRRTGKLETERDAGTIPFRAIDTRAARPCS